MASFELIVIGHVDVACLGLQVAEFFIASVKSSRELVDACASCCELLGGDVGASFNSGSESIGDGSCNFAELISAEADKSLSRARGQGGVGLAILWWVDAYLERRQRHFLDGWSGGAGDILSGWRGRGPLIVVLEGVCEGNDAGVNMGDRVPRVVGWCGTCWAQIACSRASGQSAVRRVENFGHVLVVVGTVGVLAEGGVGVLVLEGFGLWFLLVLVMLTVG